MRIIKKLGLLFFLAFFIGFFLSSPPASARENVTEWYIKDFDSFIRVNKDSTLDITESIIADCGTGVNKHGIFRVLPEKIKIQNQGTIKTPVELIGITDFNGRALKYTESRNSFDGTVTWKIGDPDITVQGVNFYQIHYLVKNTIRFNNAGFDELYWNLTGNFWDLEIDKFHAAIVFPAAVNQANSTVEYYTGALGEKRKDLANFYWSSPDTLEFDSVKTLAVKQGITASIIFPKNIFAPYEFGWLETYGQYYILFLPLLVFIICFYLWRRYGDDPTVDKTVIAEYEIPGNLTPLEAGMLMANGKLSNSYITAEIIYLATKGLISIKQTDEKILIFHSRDYELTKNSNPEAEQALNRADKIILENIFIQGETVKLSSLKNKFYKTLKDIKRETVKLLDTKGYIAATGLSFQAPFLVIGIIAMIIPFQLGFFSLYFSASVFSSGLIFFIFSLIMPKRTLEGANLNWQIKGFKLFMKTVDKHRAEFYEKENIFEKFLPYAVVFGITGLWIKKMKEIYGADFYASHAPVWCAGSVTSFDANSLSDAMDSLSSSIAASTSSPSGSGGAGGAGGGGGGGGGGGW